MITCYLDSQDYSVLTDPKTLNEERVAIRKALVQYARSSRVKFVFSAAAICESVALSPEASGLAEKRAELLTELCGTNALLSFDRLLKTEVASMRDRSGPPASMIDPAGNWFPEFEDVVTSADSPFQEMVPLAERDLKEAGMSRQQRRAAIRRSVKNGRPRGELKQRMDEQSAEAIAEQLIRQWPMRPEHAAMIVRWCLGRASAAEFNQALLDCLRDPRWMMKWFSSDHSLSSPITAIVRGPGQELGALMRRLVGVSLELLAALRSSSPDVHPRGRSGEIARRWTEMEERQLIGLVEAHSLKLGAPIPGGVSVSDVDHYCPGVSTTIRSLFSSVWMNVGGGRREETSDSQPVDALHGMYAPYVDVFRADRFMAPHIQRQVTRHGTIVVPRLSQLPDALATQLSLVG